MELHHPLKDCRWIAADPQCQSPVFTRRWQARRVLSATLHITGLGYFCAGINGKPVTRDVLQPVCSEYGPRDLGRLAYPLKDSLAWRIYYCSYDVTELLREGENLLTIQLGNGWYRQNERLAEGQVSYGDTLKTVYCLTLYGEDGVERICSDGTEVWQESAIVYNNLFVGEVHDLLRCPGPERPVTVLPDEPAELSPQIGTPDRIAGVLAPVLLREIDGVRIYDAGINISGLVRLRVNGTPGQSVVLRFAENLNEDGSLNFESTGAGHTCAGGMPQIQKDVCICGEEEAEFCPKFCWHAFRYFSLEGPGFDPEVLVIHADAPVTAEFTSDCEGMNFLFDAFVRTQLNNMHGSIPSDCPHRERLGYSGDGQVACGAAMMALDAREFYRKWIRDILDCQDSVSGHTQHTAPLGGGGGGPVGWGGAIVVVPYRYFKHYGDSAMMGLCWEPVMKWLNYLESRMDDGLVTREEEKGWCLGDWATPEAVAIPAPFVNTCLLIRYLDMLEEMAPVLGREADLPRLEELRKTCREGVLRTYFDDGTGSFCGGVQGADAYGIYAGLGDGRTGQALLEKYEALGCFDTGFIGTDVLMQVLMECGAYDLAYRLLAGENCGSYLYMKRRGATTLWEFWDGRESHDHPMFGGCVRQLFEGFLGIRQKRGTGGYTDFCVEPNLPESMQFMRGSLMTPDGRLTVTLRRTNGIVIPEIVKD